MPRGVEGRPSGGGSPGSPLSTACEWLTTRSHRFPPTCWAASTMAPTLSVFCRSATRSSGTSSPIAARSKMVAIPYRGDWASDWHSTSPISRSIGLDAPARMFHIALTMASTADSAPVALVELRGVSRSFGGVRALDAVDLELWAGQVHALVGENGAGKSTLVKILTGVEHPDTGEILIDGQRQVIDDAMAAHKLGIAAMYQEPTVFPDLTVAENIFAGRRPRGPLGLVDWPTMQRQAQRLLDALEVDLPADRPVRGLGVADRQLLQIAKPLSPNALLPTLDLPPPTPP